MNYEIISNYEIVQSSVTQRVGSVIRRKVFILRQILLNRDVHSPYAKVTDNLNNLGRAQTEK